MWLPRPSLWLALSSATDILLASLLAVEGIAMAPLSVPIVAATLAAAAVFAIVADVVKIPVFRHLEIA